MNETIKQTLLGEDPFIDIIGQNEVKKQLKSALLSKRHIIVIGPPGIGKTTLAKSIAKLLPEIELNDCSYHCSPTTPICPECKSGKSQKKVIKGLDRFIRIQGSPDLCAEDLLGDIDPIKAMKFGPLSIEAFMPGKIFKANKGILFFDELNRCPEKLQNALLQVLEEGKATLGSYEVDINADFIFVGTMNPEDSSTEKLSDVLLDRFDLVYMGYPETTDIERQIMISKGTKLEVETSELMQNMIVDFVRFLRENRDLEKHPSVRATLGLYERAQANAMIEKKSAVEQSHVKEAILSVLAHRIRMKPSVRYLKEPREFLTEQLESFFEENDAYSSVDTNDMGDAG